MNRTRQIIRTVTALVPELLVADIDASLAFWCNLCGFEVVYERPEEGFAYIARGAAHVMLEQVGVGRKWITAQLVPPLDGVSTSRSLCLT